MEVTVFLFLMLSTASVLANTTGEEVMLAWNVTARVTSSEKHVLKHTSGTAKKGTIHAIIGPSGSGKSTVINVLSNTVPKGSLQLRGHVSSAETMSPIYVAQDDLLFAQLTSEETLETSGILRSKVQLPGKAGLREIATKSLNTLGLKKVRATKVGDAKTRGLSGGEKKRLSIGNELIGDKSKGGDESVVIFADEPTSGLDSFQAQNVMSLLRELASQGNTVITAVHQPRASILAMFDDITLLSEGEVCYSGPANQMATFFASIGYPAPSKGVNPAEYLVDLISVDYSSPASEVESRERLNRIHEAFARSTYADGIRSTLSALQADGTLQGQAPTAATLPSKVRSIGWTGRVRLASLKTKTLLVRAWRTITRDKALNIARFASSTFSALLFGAIYYRLGKGASTVPDRLGLLQVAAVNTAMTSLIKATTSFVQEKLIVNRERRADHSYSVLSYFASKLLAEAPLSAFFPCFAGVIMYKLCGLNPSPGRLGRFVSILTVESFASSSFGMLVGSYASSQDAAIAMAPALMVIFIVFGGLYVVNTPKWLSFVPKVSLIRWAYEALCVNELEGLELVPEARLGPKSASSGSQVLESMGMGGSSVRNALLAQAGIIAFNYVATYVSLLRQKPQFEKISPYNREEDQERDGQGKVKTVAAADGEEVAWEAEAEAEGEDKGEGEVKGGQGVSGSRGMRSRKRRSRTSPPTVSMKANTPPIL